ncbi:putative transporter slc-17.2 [Nephila pilipes]|uniref:Putative transporter slc-17.2 n=1 Tax=Nephila pilipes TaxID=299642 RepID=A0A8X6MP13_NEPPI|nr:putative transporter slc-17.2 [Nephila pilipes]
MGISNTVSSLTGFLTPMVVGALTDGNNTLHQWRIVFIITAIILVIESFVFIFFSTAEKQDWADQSTSDVISTIPKTQAAKRSKYSHLN